MGVPLFPPYDTYGGSKHGGAINPRAKAALAAMQRHDDNMGEIAFPGMIVARPCKVGPVS